jgi:hypothetical protein
MNAAMAGPRHHTRSGGSLLAVSLIAGALGGTIAGQPSIGFLVGLGVGLVMLTLIWLGERRKG